jgi:hypothetical protein
MKTRSKTEITVETHRILTIRRGGRYRIAYCEECGEQTRMVTVAEATILAGASSRAIYRLIEARQLHFLETPDREALICLISLGNLS